MITAHVVGASGYAAAELIRLIDRHPGVALGVLESRSQPGAAVGDVFPWLPHVHVALDETGTALRARARGRRRLPRRRARARARAGARSFSPAARA